MDTHKRLARAELAEEESVAAPPDGPIQGQGAVFARTTSHLVVPDSVGLSIDGKFFIQSVEVKMDK